MAFNRTELITLIRYVIPKRLGAVTPQIFNISVWRRSFLMSLEIDAVNIAAGVNGNLLSAMADSWPITTK